MSNYEKSDRCQKDLEEDNPKSPVWGPKPQGFPIEIRIWEKEETLNKQRKSEEAERRVRQLEIGKKGE